MKEELKSQIKYFLCNKTFMIILTLVTILGYGYGVIHGSMGVDDVCISLYFGEGIGLSIGRWPFYLINKVFHVAEYSPMFLDLIAVIILMFAAILWCSLIRYIIKREVGITAYIIFATMFVNYSLIAEVFIYTLQNGVPIIYCFIAIALFALFHSVEEKLTWKRNIKNVAIISLLVSVSIGFYESAAVLFLFGVLFIILVDAINGNLLEATKWKKFFMTCFMATRIVVYAILSREIINRFCMWIFKVEEQGYRSVTDSFWLFKNPGKIINIILETIRDYYAVEDVYYPIKVFLIASVLFLGILIYESIVKKRFGILLVGILMFGSMFLLSLFQGESVPYRAAQTFNIYVAFTLFVCCYYVQNFWKPIRWAAVILIASLVYNSAFDLNQWFRFEYEKNQMELTAVHQIAEDLKEIGYIPYSKPLVFIGEYTFDEEIIRKYSVEQGHENYWVIRQINDYLEIPPYYRYKKVDALSNSVLTWGVEGLHQFNGYNGAMYWLFREAGHEISVGTDEMYLEAVEIYLNELPDYPLDGYIKECEEYIVIKL